MKIIITIDTGNAAFVTEHPKRVCGTEVSSILSRLSGRIRHTELERGEQIRLLDSNGNVVGNFKVA